MLVDEHTMPAELAARARPSLPVRANCLIQATHPIVPHTYMDYPWTAAVWEGTNTIPDELAARARPSLPVRASERPGEPRVSTMLAGSTVMPAAVYAPPHAMSPMGIRLKTIECVPETP